MAALFHQKNRDTDETQIFNRSSRLNGILTENMSEAQAFLAYKFVAERLEIWKECTNFSMLNLDRLCEMDKHLDVFPILKYISPSITEAFKSLEVLSESEMRAMPVDVFVELAEYLNDLTPEVPIIKAKYPRKQAATQ